MFCRQSCLLFAAALVADSLVVAREWRSLDGQRAVQGAFVAVRGDQLVLLSHNRPTSIPMSALAAEDRQFAQSAQAIAEGAVRWGPQSFEISQVMDHGMMCRLALPQTPGSPVLYTGEMFFLVSAGPSKARPGDRLERVLLHAAGGRTYHPLKGDPSPVRAFALSAEEAAQVWTETVAKNQGDSARQSPPVYEPEIELVTTRGVGIIVGKSGLLVVDAGLVKGASTLVVHHGGEHHEATTIMTDEGPGLAVLSCKLALEPPRIGNRKPGVPGQDVYVLNAELGSTRKSISRSPTVTRGIISRPPEEKTGAFQHDAKITPESVGGFILGSRGEVLGIYFNSQSTSRSPEAKREKAISSPADPLGRGISTTFLAGFLDKIPGAGSLKSSAATGVIEETSKELMDGVLLVVSTREVRRVREPVASKPAKSSPATPAGGASATGWSLSKSGTRHNSKCRFYSAQSPCAATDGKPCKVCGG